MESTNKNYKLTCMLCGFFTTHPIDMLQHLSYTQKYSQENCRLKIINMEEVHK